MPPPTWPRSRPMPTADRTPSRGPCRRSPARSTSASCSTRSTTRPIGEALEAALGDAVLDGERPAPGPACVTPCGLMRRVPSTPCSPPATSPRRRASWRHCPRRRRRSSLPSHRSDTSPSQPTCTSCTRPRTTTSRSPRRAPRIGPGANRAAPPAHRVPPLRSRAAGRCRSVAAELVKLLLHVRALMERPSSRSRCGRLAPGRN